MTKKTRNRNLVIGIILIVGLIFVASQTDIFPFAVTGTSTLSLTQADLQSSNPYLDGKVWLLTFVEGDLAQRYFGTFSPSDVQSATSDASTTTKSFSIEVEYSDQKCNYDISRAYRTPLYDIKKITWIYAPWNPCTEAESKTRGLNNILYFGKYPTSLKCFAIGYNEKSIVGSLDSPDVQSTFDVTINAGTESATKTINTLSGTTQGPVGNFAYVDWLGNLVTGKSCPDKDPYTPLYISGYWRLGDSDAYSTYTSLLRTSPGTNEDNQDIWLNNIQNEIVKTKLSQSFGTIFSSTSLDNAVVKLTLKDPVQFPVTTLYIKASTIGIYTPTPEVKFISSSSECFKTGTEGYISTTLENIGDESGTWNVYAQCPSPFTATRNVLTSINAGQQKTVYIPLSASASQEIKRTCTIYAESPAGVKSTTVETCVKPHVTCTPNDLFCSISQDKEVIKKCSSDGVTSSIIEICQVGEYCKENGVPQCVEEAPLPECKWYDIGCHLKNFLGGVSDFFKSIVEGTVTFFNIVKYGFVLIVFIFATLFGKDLFSSLKAVENKEWLAWILALIVAGILAYLVFTVFWVGLILFIVYLIFRFVVGGKAVQLKRGIKKLRK